MSSTGSGGGGIDSGAVSKPFFCYQCDRTVNITVSASADPSCPLCNGGFVEESDSPSSNPNLTDFPPSDPLSSFLTSLFDLQTRQHQLSNPNPNPNLDPLTFDPYAFLQNRLADLRAGGAQIQFVVENSPVSDPSGFRLPGNFGDYVIGPGLEQLIQQLAENDPNRYGTPPASKSAIDALPTVKITEHATDSEMNQCAVCKDEFETGSEAKQMPCRHLYHKECILPWLEVHNSCPVCRYELPTDDPDYESRVRGAQGTQGAQGNRTAERSFSISLPWPFGGRGSGSGTSGGGGSGGARNNSETTEEPLD